DAREDLEAPHATRRRLRLVRADDRRTSLPRHREDFGYHVARPRCERSDPAHGELRGLTATVGDRVMSEIGWNGRSLQIWKDGVKIAAVREKTATHTREPIDVTTDDSNGDRTLLPAPAMRAIDVQVAGVATEDNFQVFLQHWKDDVFLDVEVRNPD